MTPPLLAIALVVAGAAQEPASRRDVTGEYIQWPLNVHLPVGTCDVASAAESIATHLEIPFGIERIPGPCTFGPAGAVGDDVVLLNSTTVAEALNRLRKIDPRYYWTESDGVISVRPLAAWADKEHFLHGTIKSLQLEKANIGEALDTIVGDLRNDPPTGRLGALIARDIGEITLSRTAISIIDALDAVVRADGHTYWTVEYCKPEVRKEFATVGIFQHRGKGIAAPLGRPVRDETGKMQRPCELK